MSARLLVPQLEVQHRSAAKRRRTAEATTQTYIVEKIDPSSTLPHLTDEEHHCKGALEAAIQIEDLAGGGDVEEITPELLAQASYQHIDQESGVEVSARAVEGAR